ncbi:MAG: PilN domain-containing protein [bacterium]
MIKINLLTPEEISKQKNFAKIIMISTSLIILGIFFLFISFAISIKVANLNKLVIEQKQELERYQPIIRKCEEMKKIRDEALNKVEIRNNLRKKQEIWPKMLEYINNNVPETVWLTLCDIGYNKTKNRDEGRIDGYAFSNMAICSFVKNLTQIPYFNNIKLISTQSGQVEEKKIISFKIIFFCNLSTPSTP